MSLININRYHEILDDVRRYGNLEIIKEMSDEILLFDMDDVLFQSSCKCGHIEVAKWLVETFKDIDIHAENEHTFRLSCSTGQIEVVKWLVETFKDIDIHADNEGAFRWSCRWGKIEAAKWLVETFKDIDIHAQNDDAFRSSCYAGKIEVAEWLVETFEDIDICADDSKTVISVFRSHRNFFDKLIDIFGIRYNNDQIIKDAHDKNENILVKYLCDTYPYYEMDGDAYKIIDCVVKHAKR